MGVPGLCRKNFYFHGVLHIQSININVGKKIFCQVSLYKQSVYVSPNTKQCFCTSNKRCLSTHEIRLGNQGHAKHRMHAGLNMLRELEALDRPRLMRARLCRVDSPTEPPRKTVPAENPARSMSQAADNFF